MVDFFGAAGGIATGNELAGWVQDHRVQPILLLARAIVCRRVVSFPWNGVTLLPLFPFESDTIVVRACARKVIAELIPAFDDGEVAKWFALANSWLYGQVPAVLIDSDPASVSDAARANRIVTTG